MKPLPYKRHTNFCNVDKSYEGVLRVIEIAKGEGQVGGDLEFNSSGPTIIGVASENEAAAWYWDSSLGQALIDSNVVIVAYSGLGSDKPVIEKALGIKTPLERWACPLHRHYIFHPDLASIPKNQGGEDTQDLTLAAMNLWVCTSLLHDLPYWKGTTSGTDNTFQDLCFNEKECLALNMPCRLHDPLAYCAIDAWAGLIDEIALKALMEEA